MFDCLTSSIKAVSSGDDPLAEWRDALNHIGHLLLKRDRLSNQPGITRAACLTSASHRQLFRVCASTVFDSSAHAGIDSVSSTVFPARAYQCYASGGLFSNLLGVCCFLRFTFWGPPPASAPACMFAFAHVNLFDASGFTDMLSASPASIVLASLASPRPAPSHPACRVPRIPPPIPCPAWRPPMSSVPHITPRPHCIQWPEHHEHPCGC